MFRTSLNKGRSYALFMSLCALGACNLSSDGSSPDAADGQSSKNGPVATSTDKEEFPGLTPGACLLVCQDDETPDYESCDCIRSGSQPKPVPPDVDAEAPEAP